MPLFKYRGYNAEGSDITGVVEASGINDALFTVKSNGIFPVEVKEAGVKRRRGIFRQTSDAFLPNMTRQLSMLISSGVPMIQALNSLSAENKGFYRGVLVSIKERVAGGSGLHKALGEFSHIFPEFYINMVMAGEQSGTLGKVLAQLAGFLEKQNAAKAKVRSSMIYPVFMMAVSIVVLSFLFTFVIPKIVKIFRDTQSALPFATVILIFISNIFVNYWWALIGFVIAASVSIKRFFRSRQGLIDKLILKLPGNIIQSLYYARFARTLGFLLDGGLPMLRALKLSAGSMGNRILEESVFDAERKVAEGQSLSSTLEKFPPVFVQLVSTGEKSGKLPETLNMAADSYEEEFNRKVSRAVTVFEPTMILVMGLVVGFIVLGVLLPMFQLNQLIK
jgi:general secretion pathway protein F